MPSVYNGQASDDPLAVLRTESASASAPPTTGYGSSTESAPLDFLNAAPRAPAAEVFGGGGIAIETICPFCHKKHAIAQADVRKQMRCPGCHHTFTANPLTGLGIAAKTPPPSVAPPVGTRSPAGMPPLPDSPPSQATADPFAFLSDAGTKQPTDLLTGYQATRQRNSSPFAGIAEAVKRPIRVARLRRQVSGLQQALDAAWEKLGTLALGHRPFHSHLSAEVPELSALQRQVNEKQSMADSLRHAVGSKAVLKEVEVELAELRDRQRRLMIAIGQKAEANTPDIPDGPAHYAAVKRLRSSLEAAERELLGIEGVNQMSAGRLVGGGSDFLSRAKMPLIAAGAVLALILVLCGGWWLLGGLFRSGYDVEYNLVSDGTFPNLAVRVKGKAAKLAVILTSPNGESDTNIIESERMITNNATVKFHLTDSKPGRYVLSVKTFYPEAVVVKKNIDFSLRGLKVESVDFVTKPVTRMGDGQWIGSFDLIGLVIKVRKDGNLPVPITGAAVQIDGTDCMFCNTQGVLVGQSDFVRVTLQTIATPNSQEADQKHGWGGFPANTMMLWPGTRYTVSGKLFYGKDGEKFLNFQKELVVSKDMVDQAAKEGPQKKRPNSQR
jgi:hypothetical protein